MGRKGKKGGSGGHQKTLDFSPNWSDEEENAYWESIDGGVLHEISQEHVYSVYRVKEPHCTRNSHKKNCESNPHCFAKLGEKTEGIWNQTQTKRNMGPDPRERLRPPNQVVGLRNLGATCYMNSLLQCLFMNPMFRKGIFGWCPQGEDKSTSSEAIRELQMLFARMQMGNKKWVSPKVLCHLLNLKTGVQQDIQEFNKLFLSFLEEQFAGSHQSELKSLLSDQFSAKHCYITTCKKCGSVSKRFGAYNELELHIKDKSTLDQCLEEYIKVEELTDDNRYDCATCQGRQDATRSISLITAPEVLNIQLMRFVYDLKTFTKRKLRTVISYPQTLDLNPYINEESKSKSDPEKNIYELTAVLIHSGPSAYGGHYTAQIRDEETGTWWKFDDEKVVTLDPAGMDEGEEEIEDTESKKSKGKAKSGKSKGKAPASQPVEGRYSSSNAYTLVYTRKGRPIPKDLLPNESIRGVIEEKSKKLEEKGEKYEKVSKESEAHYEQHISDHEAFVSILHPPASSEVFHWISTEWLSSWIKGERKPVNNSNLLCEHRKVDPNKITAMKIISRDAWQLLKKCGGGPELTNNDMCMDCVRVCSVDKSAQDVVENRKQHILRLLAGNPSQGFNVPRTWLTSWKKIYPSPDLPENITAAITCEHGNRAILQAQKLAVVSAQAWKRLSELHPASVPFRVPGSVCEICSSQGEAVSLIKNSRKKEREREKESFQKLVKFVSNKEAHYPVPEGKYHCVPEGWLGSWIDYLDDPDIEELPEAIPSQSLLCPHDKLKFDPLDPNSSLYLIQDPDWNALRLAYGNEEPELKCTVKKTGPPILEPPICEGCTKAREKQERVDSLTYENATVDVIVGEDPKKTPTKSGRYSLRSTRSMSAHIRVNSTDTIHTLKLKVMEQLDIPPSRQQLIYYGETLGVDEMTLAASEITPKSRIYVQILEAKDDADNDADFIERHQSEEGFKGTSLSGRRTVDTETKRSWQCECGYGNSSVDSVCSLCGRNKPSSSSSSSFSSFWACETCTGHNSLEKTRCEHCSARPRKLFKSSSDHIPSGNANGNGNGNGYGSGNGNDKMEIEDKSGAMVLGK